MNFMNQAFLSAKRALSHDDVPIGAVIIKDNKIIARGENRVQTDKNPTKHAEIVAINKACKKLDTKFLDGCDLYVTLEPCAMCAGAISWARLDAVFYGAADPKTGAVRQGAKVFTRPQTHHKPKNHLILTPECGKIMSQFFQKKRLSKKV